MSHWFLIVAASLHTFFMAFELFPWSTPFSLRFASKSLPSLPPGETFTAAQERLVTARQQLTAAIVHNAGIYNGIIAGGLFWAACVGDPAADVARVMLAGATAAGIFGTVTLKSGATAVQALVGIAGLFLLYRG